MQWLALDIGGANLKAADGQQYAHSQAFALWQKHRSLPDALRNLLSAAPRFDHLAVTMTGELADCFTTRSEGVQFILEAVMNIADKRVVKIYSTREGLIPSKKALKQPLDVAAGNWHALASFAGRLAPTGLTLLIDIGSTTTDIIPLLAGQCAAVGKNDVERLIAGELVYAGVERTPVSSIVNALPYRGEHVPIASELFATTRDVYLTLGDLEPQPSDLGTANGKPATKSYARDRLAHLFCLDRDTFEDRDATEAAEAVDRQLTARIATALAQVTGRFDEHLETVIVSGQGEFFIRRLLDRLRIRCRVVSLEQELGKSVSRCAPAHALAVLAREAAANGAA
jgi:(4-(4-[2-(gamma-L-glutamylamino)ethyl]phenoxymethyl)furan-2-yl)methanamine synthase